MNSPRPVLKVNTADNVAVGWDIAGIGSRVSAQLLDGLIVGIVELVVVVVVLAAAQSNGAAAALAAVGVSLFVYCGYFLACEVVTGGRTPGKSALGLRVISVDGGTPTVGQFAIRNIARLLDNLAGLGAVVMFVNRSSRRIGDLLAGTVVVHTRPATSLAAALAPPPVVLRVADAGPAVDNLGRLGAHELNALRAFLSRPGLEPAVRARLAAEIADRLVTRLELPPAAPERRWPPELLLERLYLQLQDRVG